MQVLKKNAALQIRKTLKRGGKLIAIGTTVMRVLESSVFTNNGFQAFDGSVDTFIKPGHKFKVFQVYCQFSSAKIHSFYPGKCLYRCQKCKSFIPKQ